MEHCNNEKVQSRWKRFLRILAVAGILTLTTAAYGFQSVVVLPFSNQSQDQHLYWLGEGFAESLSEEMLLKDAYVIQRVERRKAYDELRLPYIGDLSRATMLKIGDKLSADYIIFGSYRLKESILEVQARVVHLPETGLSEPIVVSGALDSLYSIQKQLRELLQQYFKNEGIAIAEESRDVKPVPLYAYEWYIKGLVESTDQDRIALYQRAMQAHPGYPQAAYRQGIALARLGRYRESTDILRKAEFSGILQLKARFLIAVNFYQQHDYEAAYQAWMELSKLVNSAEIMNNMGVALLKKGDLQGAGWYLSKAVELSPENGDYRFNLAASYVLRSYDKNAATQYREAIRRSPSDFHSLYLLAKLLEREGSPISQLVMHSFREVLPSDQKGKFPEQYTSVTQLVRIAPALLSTEEGAYQLIVARRQEEDRSNYVKSYQGNARKYLEDEDPEKAILEIRKAAGLAPLDWYVRYLWGWSLNQQKNTAEAVAELEFSVWCNDNIESHLLLAEILRLQENYEGAKLQVQRTLALQPGNKKALEIWGKIWDKE